MIFPGSAAARRLIPGSPEYMTDAHQRLEALNAEVEQLYELMPFGSYLTDSDGTILSINSAAIALFGRDRQELVGKPIPIDFLNSGDSGQVMPALDPYEGSFDDCRLSLDGGNGTACHVFVSGRQLGDFAGAARPHRFCVVKVAGTSQKAERRSARGVDVVCRQITARGPPHLTASKMAALTGLTTRALHYAFRRRFGCTPVEWQRAHFLDLAHAYLTSDHVNAPVKAVARRFGFASTASFARFYKRRFGRNPSDQAPEQAMQASR